MVRNFNKDKLKSRDQSRFLCVKYISKYQNQVFKEFLNLTLKKPEKSSRLYFLAYN